MFDGMGSWLAFWPTDDNPGGTVGTDIDIFYARSTDGGTTWLPARVLNTNANTDSGLDWDLDVATDGSGNWVAVWTAKEFKNPGSPIFDAMFTRSSDNGETWADPQLLKTRLEFYHVSDGFPRITTDGAGTWVATWHSPGLPFGPGRGTDDDIVIRRSTDNGATWTDPTTLNSNTGVGSNVWDRSAVLKEDGNGNWLAVWSYFLQESDGSTNTDLYFSRSIDGAATWTDAAPLNGNADSSSGDNLYPQIATAGDGHWICAWQSNDTLDGTVGEDWDIFYAVSSDGGLHWAAPKPLNLNARSDTGDDYTPFLIFDGQKTWAAAWHSTDDLGGQIGSDFDVLFSFSWDNGTSWTSPSFLAHAKLDDESSVELEPDLGTDGAGQWVAVWNMANVFVSARFVLPDCDGNDVPDECSECLAGCECDDRDLCTFDLCVGGSCTNTPAAHADVAGNGAICGPDGAVNLSDILAVLDGFQGVFATGCEVSNIDIASQSDGCVSDGTIDLFDILAVLDAFQGAACCQ